MTSPPPFEIDPPLLNSACPWATTFDDIADLYNCPYTGAITIRTSLLKGFNHDPSIHQHAFFSPSAGGVVPQNSKDGSEIVPPDVSSSLNTLGYSPIPLPEYLSWIALASLGGQSFTPRPEKPIIISVTGTASEVAECYKHIVETQSNYPNTTLFMEINLSCPNIPDKPPPAYDSVSLSTYLTALSEVPHSLIVPIGIKTPPYTYQAQYAALLDSLKASMAQPAGCPISFITATNTLGSCLVLQHHINGWVSPAIQSASGEGIGGMAGAALHPLALGNVATLTKMLKDTEGLTHVKIIGVGGVSDRAGFVRMRAVGAAAIGLATALGMEGVGVFGKIMEV